MKVVHYTVSSIKKSVLKFRLKEARLGCDVLVSDKKIVLMKKMLEL